jgi:3-hydroxyisobutyrate dehydrogenase-like beta-hydroxyacid dehydrogenase
VRAGHQVTVWNRTASRAEPVAQAGGRVAGSAAEAVREAEVAFTMLADDDAVSGAVFGREGDGGMLGALHSGATHVCSSTISVALSRRLIQAHAGAGQAYVAAPVFGRPAAAEAGKLTVVAAGPAPARGPGGHHLRAG